MPRTDPPAAIRRELRREVGFGCPVDGCGSPYLTWHHFDPPWRDGEQHEASGMVALCLQHHKEADGGAFTHEQLHAFKKEPYLVRVGGRPEGRFNWKREQLILDAGGGFFVRIPVFLAVSGRPIVWLSSDADGNQLLNLDIWDAAGQLTFSMRDNDWMVLGDLDDLEAPPGTRSLTVRAPSKGIRVSVAFARTSMEQVRDRLRIREQDGAARSAAYNKAQLDELRAAGAPEEVLESFRKSIDRTDVEMERAVDDVMQWIKQGWAGSDVVRCTLEAQIPFPVPVHVTATKITLPNNIVISGTVAVDGDVAIAIG